MAYEVTIAEMTPEPVAGVRGTYRIADLAEVMGREFGRIMVAIAAQGARPAGSALTIYHGWTEDEVDAEIAFTIEGDFVPQEDVKPGTLPGGRVATTVHVGPYDQLGEAYEAIQRHAEANGLALAELMWERYLTDPAVEPDLNKHVTEVFWPLA
jgi:effector-binding domain-containing protein